MSGARAARPRDSMQFAGGDDCAEPSGYAHDLEQDERPEADGPKVSPPSAPSVNHPRAVFCPHCGAVAGKPCLTSSGVRYRGGAKGQRTIHSARRDAFEEIARLAAASASEGAGEVDPDDEP